jgi:hypothetical protein
MFKQIEIADDHKRLPSVLRAAEVARRRHARDLVVRARREARDIVEGATQETEALRMQAYADGFRAGLGDSVLACVAQLAAEADIGARIDSAVTERVAQMLEHTLVRPEVAALLVDAVLQQQPADKQKSPVRVHAPEAWRDVADAAASYAARHGLETKVVLTGDGDRLVVECDDTVYTLQPALLGRQWSHDALTRHGLGLSSTQRHAVAADCLAAASQLLHKAAERHRTLASDMEGGANIPA